MTTSSTHLSLIVDDADNEFFSFNNATSESVALFAYYQGTGHAAASNDTRNTFVDITFTGTSIAIFGNTAVLSLDDSLDTFMVSIDGAIPYPTGYGDLNPPSYRQWYQSPALSEGSHNISLSGIDLLASIDYAVVTTSLSLNTVAENGQVIIVDDGDQAIKYMQDWTDTSESFDSAVFTFNSSLRPYGNFTHETNATGSSFNYNFVGDGNITVFGIFDWRNLGNLNLTFTLDGNETPADFDVTADKIQPGFVQPNFVYYQGTTNSSSDGTHMLVVDVVDVQNLTFVVDYITFAPSNIPSNGKKSRVGDIIGGVLGGIGLLVLSFVAFDCFLRMKRKNTRRRSFDYPFRTGPGFSTNDYPLSPTGNANKDALTST